jgi:YHS domain-containing protein
MIRRFIIEFILPLLLFFIVRSMFKGMASSVSTPRQRPEEPRVSAGGELKKDPVCGTYVSTSAALSKKAGGETVYFCSAECRDRYRG